MKIGFITNEKWAHFTPDDAVAAAELRRRGHHVEPLVWTHTPAVDHLDLLIIRSPWDYHYQPARFISWLRDVAAKAPLQNPLATALWNIDKKYLRDLQSHGIRTPETVWIGHGTTRLNDLPQWSTTVIKPAISASAYKTYKIEGADRDRIKQTALELAQHTDVLMQEFMSEVQEEGEWSLIFFNGQFSHANLKAPAPGDFRVQAEHGGSVQAATPNASLIEFAERSLSHAGGVPLYARVDIVNTRSGCVLMELELVEPKLFFGWHPHAAARFADAIQSLRLV